MQTAAMQNAGLAKPDARGPDDALAEALAHQRAGRGAMAGLCYASLLQRHPDYPQALHARGLAAWRDARHEDAILAMGGLVALQPGVAALHRDLGIICAAAQKLEWAELCLARAAELEPVAGTWAVLGAVRLRLGKPLQAETALRAALLCDPGGAECHALLGVVLLRTDRRAAAERELEHALAAAPGGAAAHNAIGMLSAELGDAVTAEAQYRAALRLDPADEVVWNNLAKLLRDQGRPEEAIAAAEEAVRLRPDHADGHCVLGHALTAAGRLAEADRRYAAALALQPDHAESRYHRGLAALLDGRLREGWEGYAWRWRRRGHAPPHAFTQPEWDGSPLGHANLLLHAEQGCGDTIMMARFVAGIAAKNRVVLLVQPGLERLMAGIPGVKQAVASAARLPGFDVQFPLMSLPGLFVARAGDDPGDHALSAARRLGLCQVADTVGGAARAARGAGLGRQSEIPQRPAAITDAGMFGRIDWRGWGVLGLVAKTRPGPAPAA